MKTIKLNHIQHYPMGENGVKMIDSFKRISTLVGLYYEPNQDWTCFQVKERKQFILPNTVRLILHPLDNYKDINSDAMSKIGCDISDMIFISELANKERSWSDVPYGVIELMCEHHIDFKRLIEAGIAIDINTL